MATFCITVINEDFVAQDDHELLTLDIARRQAIKGALQIGVAEVGEGKPFFAAEVKIASDGQQLARYVVSVGVSPLR